MTRRQHQMHLTKAQASARSKKGWENRRRARTLAQKKHDRDVYMTGLKKRLVREGRCRSCHRRREPSRRHLQECKRCARISAIRYARIDRPWVPALVMRTAA